MSSFVLTAIEVDSVQLFVVLFAYYAVAVVVVIAPFTV